MDTGQAFVLSFFLDEGLEPNLLAEASQLGITKSLLERRADAAQHEDVNGTDFECVTKDIPVPMLRNQDDQFKEQFRMQRSTFQVLLQATGKAVAGSNEPISHVSLPEKLLYTLRLLSGKVSFREVGEIFAIPKSSGYEIFKWVVSIFNTLLPNYIKWPIFTNSTNGISSLPNVVGVIEEFRIPLKLPIRVANTSERQCHALALQVVSDARSRFLDVHIDVPNDLQCILMKSPLFERLIDTDQDQPLMSEQQHLVGEMSYPLLLNLMTPFPDYGDLTPCHMSYNLAVHLWNAPVERAFASLLSRFQRLQSLDITTLDLACVVVSAACMLHNFILDCGEPLEDITVDFEAMPKSQINMVFEENGQQYWEHTLAAEKKRESLVAGFLRSQ